MHSDLTFQSKNHTKTELKPKKEGLEFMAVRRNVRETMRFIRNEKIVTYAEKAALEEIVAYTIGAENPDHRICSMYDIDIAQLSLQCGYAEVNKIYTLLSSIHEKYLITRTDSKYKGCELIGLNPYFWGQVLIDSSHKIEQSRLQLVVDNSKSNVDNFHTQHTECGESTHGACVNYPRSVGSQHTERVQNRGISFEIIEEKVLLDSLRPVIDILEGENLKVLEEKKEAIRKKYIGQAVRSLRGMHA